AEQWILSPDAALWLVPWAALPLKDGRYAIERHRIHYVISGRDLVTPGLQTKAGRPLILADPDFDLEPARADQEKGEALVQRGVSPNDKLPRFERLPGTAAEARAIAPLVKGYTRGEPTVLTGKQALESTFKAARGPRLVVLSTHGFFLEDQD